MGTTVREHSPNGAERALALAVASLLVLLACAQEHVQSHQDRTERIAIAGNEAMSSCLELMPDGRTLLVATTQDHPIYVMDVTDWSVQRTIEVNGFYAGPEVKASRTGNYLLLRQKFYIDYRANQDRAVRYEVLDFATGKELVTVDKAHDAAISADEQHLYTLDGEQITLRKLPSGEVTGRIAVPFARNSMAASPDGRWIAVTHRPTVPQLETVPSIRNDKKALKPAQRFREMVSVYDALSGKLVGTVPEIYDRVYTMAFNEQGDRLLVYSVAHTRVEANGTPEGVVCMVEMPTMVPLRTGFLSLMNDPQLEPNAQGDRIALASTEGFNKRKMYVYDMHTGEFTLDLDLDQRWGRDLANKEQHDGRVPYHFLADGRTLVFGSGAWLRLITTP